MKKATQPETLHTCPKCNRGNFTARGLKAHRCTSTSDLTNPSDPSNSSPRQEATKQSSSKQQKRKATDKGLPAPGQSPAPTGKPVTLATLDAMPSGTTLPIQDMTLSQLGEAFSQLSKVEEATAKVSGIVAVLKGIVLQQAKLKAGREFMTWTKEHFPQSHRTATKYMRLATAIMGKNWNLGSNFESTAKLESLRGDLGESLLILEKSKLDLSNPIVAQVASLTEGKSAYQLLLELGDSKDPKAPKEKPLTAEEKHQQFVTRCREESISAFNGIHDLGDRFKLCSDTEIEVMVTQAEQFARKAKAWLKVPPKQRTKLDAEKILITGTNEPDGEGSESTPAAHLLPKS